VDKKNAQFVREDKYGFWRQLDNEPFEYSVEYKQSQSTNTDMSYLRVGWIAAHFPYPVLKKMKVVDIGSGNGTFVQVGESVFGSCVGFDLSGESITKKKLDTTEWDLVVLSDVLEHFDDIEDLFKLKWNHAFISFPETPKVADSSELVGWRHFKPNEHLWCLNLAGIQKWFSDHGCRYIDSGNVEDIIRRRWDEKLPNISSILVSRK
jgi:hypothetical protein